MSGIDPRQHRVPLEAYEREAQALLAGLEAGDDDSRWRFRWWHPRFRDRPVAEVAAATLDTDDARAVVAREDGFTTWADLVAFTHAVAADAPVARFEAAAEAVVSGDAATLRALLREDPELVRARSARRHAATLLHYVAANGVENGRQRTPENAVEVATILLDAGAEVDALADMYDARCTPLSMLASSGPPAEAGLQTALAETLLDHGAAIDGPGTAWTSALMTALAFGYLPTATMLAGRGARVDEIGAAAGLGRLAAAADLLPSSDARGRHVALALAAQHGHADVVRLLLDAGEDPDRYNPDGFHAHSTPLHQAALAGHLGVVRLLAERGARLDLKDTVYHATPLGWAVHGGRTEVADYLRGRGAPDA